MERRPGPDVGETKGAEAGTRSLRLLKMSALVKRMGWSLTLVEGKSDFSCAYLYM